MTPVAVIEAWREFLPPVLAALSAGEDCRRQ